MSFTSFFAIFFFISFLYSNEINDSYLRWTTSDHFSCKLQLIAHRRSWTLNTVSHNTEKQRKKRRFKAAAEIESELITTTYNLCYKLNGCKTQWIHCICWTFSVRIEHNNHNHVSKQHRRNTYANREKCIWSRTVEIIRISKMNEIKQTLMELISKCK